MKLEGKRILFLGGSSYFYEAAKYAKSEGAYVIVIDNRDESVSITKKIANESYLLNILDTDAVYRLALEKEINGVYAGASEFSIPIAIDLCEKMSLPYYCSKEQWRMCTNKRVFKNKCLLYHVPVTHCYNLNQNPFLISETEIDYPVVTKPVDNNGSTGISICRNKEELEDGIKKAKANSKTNDILIEDFIPSDSVIIHYTLQNGKAYFSGMSDKKSMKINASSAPIMALQSFPSSYTNLYLSEFNEKVVAMLEGENMMHGPIWIEAFIHNDTFLFNEIGYRYGGSLTYYPVEYFYGINQMKMLIYQSLTGNGLYENIDQVMLSHKTHLFSNKIYYIFPLQLKSGIITRILGLEEILSKDYIYSFIQSLPLGKHVEETGTVSQVFGYFHLVCDDYNSLLACVEEILSVLKVLDQDSQNMLYSIYFN